MDNNWQYYYGGKLNQENKSPFSSSGNIKSEQLIESYEFVLANEFRANESQKRTFKPILLTIISTLIFFQLIFSNAIILIIVLSLVAGDNPILFINKIDLSIVSELFDFLKYYITSTVVELLAMIYFIIRYVFDKSVEDMIKNNRNKDAENKK